MESEEGCGACDALIVDAAMIQVALQLSINSYVLTSSYFKSIYIFHSPHINLWLCPKNDLQTPHLSIYMHIPCNALYVKQTHIDFMKVWQYFVLESKFGEYFVTACSSLAAANLFTCSHTSI